MLKEECALNGYKNGKEYNAHSFPGCNDVLLCLFKREKLIMCDGFELWRDDI